VDFTFTEEQRAMAGAVRELLDDICAPGVLRAAYDGHDAGADARWSRLIELGLTGVVAPESAGGLGLSEIDLVLVAEETGRVALPEPIVEHAGVAVPLLAELASGSGAARELLAAAATGEARVAIAHQRNPFVLAADRATHVVICGDESIDLVAPEGLRLTAQPSIDALRHVFSVEASREARTALATGPAARGAAARALNRGAVFASAQCLGLTERMIELAVEYAKVRTQFGHPIGSYQAIKHHLASVQVRLEFARPVVYAAATRLAGDSLRDAVAASHAKLAATDAAELAARTAVQVHGAMGYSWEVDLHFYMKRAWALSGAWGDRMFHARRVQSALISGQLATGPEHTFAHDEDQVTS
jgi:alkylation response protein AidB-like acyl-CoA dehydrogenase